MSDFNPCLDSTGLYLFELWESLASGGHFLVAVAGARTLEAAAAAAMQADPDFNLPVSLGRLAQLGAFADWRVR